MTFQTMSNAVAPPDEPNAPPIVPKHARKPRVPAKIVKVIDLTLSGACRSTKAACERIGIDPSYASRELRKVHVAEYIRERTRIALAMSQAPAAATLMRLLDAESEHVQNDVAKHLLAIAGHKPQTNPQVSVNIELKAGYVIDLSEQPSDSAKLVTDTPVTQPKVIDAE